MDPNGLGSRVRRLAGRYGDMVIASVLAALITVELVVWNDDGLASAILLGLLATLPLALRRRTPLAAFVLAMVGSELVTRGASQASTTTPRRS